MAIRRSVWLCLAISMVLSQSASYAAMARDDDGRSINSLLRDLNTQDYSRKNEIERILGERKSESGEMLINALDNSDPIVQGNAAEILEHLSGNWDFVVSNRGLATILGIMKAAHAPTVQAHLVRVIGNVGPRNPQIQETLIYVLTKDGDVSVRSAAANALSNLVREEKPLDAEVAVKALCTALNGDLSPHVRSAAASALSQTNVLPEIAVPAITQALDDN